MNLFLSLLQFSSSFSVFSIYVFHHTLSLSSLYTSPGALPSPLVLLPWLKLFRSYRGPVKQHIVSTPCCTTNHDTDAPRQHYDKTSNHIKTDVLSMIHRTRRTAISLFQVTLSPLLPLFHFIIYFPMTFSFSVTSFSSSPQLPSPGFLHSLPHIPPCIFFPLMCLHKGV